MKSLGWIYIVVQPAMPELVKVGWTSKDPKFRTRSFDGTHAPFDHVLALRALVEDAAIVEREVHTDLESYREANEWFRISVQDAARAIGRVAAERLRALETHPDYELKAELQPALKAPAADDLPQVSTPRPPRDNMHLPQMEAHPYSDGSYHCPHCKSWRNSKEFGTKTRCLCGGALFLNNPI